MNRDRLVGVLYVMVSAASFGAMAVFARHAAASGAEVGAVLFLRFALAATVMTLIMRATGRRWPRGRHLAVLAAMGGIGYVGQSYSFFTALNHASAGLVALLLYLYPFIVTVLAALLLRRALSRARLGAVLLALGGTALTLGGGASGEPLGIALGIAAALIYSVYILVGGHVLADEDPLAAATVVMLAASFVFGAASVISTPAYPGTVTGWLAVCAIAMVSTVIAMVSFFAGLKRLGAADAATLSTLEPVVTFTLAAIFLGEALHWNQLFGGAIILGSVIWLTRMSGEIGDVSASRSQSVAPASSGRNSAL